MLDKKIVEELRKQGWTYQKIALKLNVSKQRIHQIIKNYYNTGRQDRKKLYRDFGDCKECGEFKAEILHHKDFNNENDEIDNLIALCQKCHYKKHTNSNRNIRNFHIQFDLEQFKDLRTMAAVKDVPVSELIKQAVAEFLKRNMKKDTYNL